MVLFALGLANEELPGLAVVIRETLGTQPALGATLDVRERRKTALGGFARPFAEGIRLVIDASDGIAHRHMAVLLEMMEGTFGSIDRDVREVRAAEPLQLGVEV